MHVVIISEELVAFNAMYLFTRTGWVSKLVSISTGLNTNVQLLFLASTCSQEYARFPEILLNISEPQILWSLCSLVFYALTLKLPIQTSLSVAPKLPVCLSSTENCHKFKKTSTPQVKVRVYLAISDVSTKGLIISIWPRQWTLFTPKVPHR